jgi:hypothetical protein
MGYGMDGGKTRNGMDYSRPAITKKKKNFSSFYSLVGMGWETQAGKWQACILILFTNFLDSFHKSVNNTATNQLLYFL